MQTNLTEAVASTQANCAQKTFLSLDGQFRTGPALDDETADAIVQSAFPEGLESKPGKHTVYNFEVEGTHTYIAGGYRVHNTSALDFYDDHYGQITEVRDLDGDGAIDFFKTSSDNGNGEWVIETQSIDENGTATVEASYYWESDGGRFYIFQVQTFDIGPDGEQILRDTVIKDAYLLGDAAGKPLAGVLTPFILDALEIDGAAGEILGGTIIETLIQNVA